MPATRTRVARGDDVVMFCSDERATAYARCSAFFWRVALPVGSGWAMVHQPARISVTLYLSAPQGQQLDLGNLAFLDHVQVENQALLVLFGFADNIHGFLMQFQSLTLANQFCGGGRGRETLIKIALTVYLQHYGVVWQKKKKEARKETFEQRGVTPRLLSHGCGVIHTLNISIRDVKSAVGETRPGVMLFGVCERISSYGEESASQPAATQVLYKITPKNVLFVRGH